MSFYKSIFIKLKDKSVILFPESGIERLLANGFEDYQKYLASLYKLNKKSLNKGDYHIVILWQDNEDIMTDIWVFELPHGLRDYSTIDVVNFRNSEKYYGEGVTSGDGLILLSEEEKKRLSSTSLDGYLNDR